MITTLVDAAEEIMFTQGPQALTATAVAKRAGIARNSIYRYVNSIDELPAHVLARHLPPWIEAVENALATSSDPRERIRKYVETNLQRADHAGHAQLMAMARHMPPHTLQQVDGAHQLLAATLLEECEKLDPQGAQLTAAFIRAILETGMNAIGRGADINEVITRSTQACDAIMEQCQQNQP